MRKKKQLLSEAQIRRMAAIAGIPALGTVSNIVSEKVNIDTETNEETTTETTDTEETTTEETETTNEEVVVEEEEMEMDAEAEEEPAAEEEVGQDKIESLVDAVLAAIEAETGVPAQRVDGEEEAPAEEPEMEMDAEPEMDAEEPEEEMMETLEPTLAERIAAAVQTVLDETSEVTEEGYKMEEDEEELDEGAHEDEEEVDEAHCNSKGKREDDEDLKEDTLDEITKAVVARLRSLK